jgi:hypothetical protein
VSDSVVAFADAITFIQKFEFCQALINTKLVFGVTFMPQVP